MTSYKLTISTKESGKVIDVFLCDRRCAKSADHVALKADKKLRKRTIARIRMNWPRNWEICWKMRRFV